MDAENVEPEELNTEGAKQFTEFMGKEFAEPVLKEAREITQFPTVNLVLLLSIRKLDRELQQLKSKTTDGIAPTPTPSGGEKMELR